MQEVTIDYRPSTGRIIVIVTSGHEHPDALDDCTNRAVHALTESLRQISAWPRMEPTTWREALEADARKLMAKIAANPPRGYDSLKVRDGWIAELDRMLDAYADGINPLGMQAALCGCQKLRVVKRGVLWCDWCDAVGGQPC